MALKAVVFDLDGTLVDQEGAERDALKALFDGHIEIEPKPGFNVFLRAWRNIADEHLQRYLDNKTGFDEQRVSRFMDIGRHFEVDINRDKATDLHKKYMEHYRGQWRAYPESEAALKGLQQAGYRLAVITNGDPSQQRAKLEATGLTGLFELVLVSGDIKIAKPLKGIFDHAAAALKLAPEECCYVGDRYETDALGARDAGWLAVWVNRLQMPGQAGSEGLRMVQELSELAGVLPK